MLLALWPLLVLAVLFLLFYGYGPHSRFRGYGVKYLTPVPLLGDMGRVVFRTRHWFEDMDRIYKSFPEERFIGICEFIQPVVVIKDPELVRCVMSQDFQHFTDHNIAVDPNIDNVFGRNVFVLKGKHWRDVRAKFTPFFSITRLRQMMPLIEEAGDNLLQRINAAIKETGNGYLDIDIKDASFRFATDVYASSAFGLRLDSQNAPSQFYEMSKLLVTVGYKELMKIMGFQITPNMMQKLKLTLFNIRSTDFFKNFLKEVYEQRETQEVRRYDMIDLLIQFKKDNLNQKENKKATDIDFEDAKETNLEEDAETVTDEDFIAQMITLLVGGTEAIASSMAFMAHELALNPDVQERLLNEIEEHRKNNGGKINFDSIQGMIYLDMVVSEVMRMWGTNFVDRLCTKDYNLGRPNDKATKDFIIRKGEGVKIYIHSLANDPKYFPQPRKFDPERFSEENRHKIPPGTNIPYGLGPRLCIGYLFARIELKVMICTLLQHMEILTCEKTSRNIKISKNHLNLVADGGHWVRLQPRT